MKTVNHIHSLQGKPLPKLTLLLAFLALLLLVNISASADTFTFTAGQVASTMAAAGAPLSNGSNQWGLWAVRVMPIVGGSGLYSISGGSTSQTGWGTSAPGAFGAAPYTASNSVWFFDNCGSENSTCSANPLYMIMDKAANTFESYRFVPPGTFTGTCTSSATLGCNLVTAVDPSSTFTVSFALGAGATWDGRFQFVVDGTKYTSGTVATPAVWVEDFWGGYGTSGGLAGNTVNGYLVTPEPASVMLFGCGLLTLAGAIRRKR